MLRAIPVRSRPIGRVRETRARQPGPSKGVLPTFEDSVQRDGLRGGGAGPVPEALGEVTDAQLTTRVGEQFCVACQALELPIEPVNGQPARHSTVGTEKVEIQGAWDLRAAERSCGVTIGGDVGLGIGREVERE
jgi:hypothetical protein